MFSETTFTFQELNLSLYLLKPQTSAENKPGIKHQERKKAFVLDGANFHTRGEVLKQDQDTEERELNDSTKTSAL